VTSCWGSLLTLSSSWCMLVFHSRTFSNTLESILLVAIIYVTLDIIATINPKYRALNRKQSLNSSLLLGSLLACGVFTRFTFIFFSFGLGLCYLYCAFKSKLMKRILTESFRLQKCDANDQRCFGWICHYLFTNCAD
jgi:hypothetical protein